MRSRVVMTVLGLGAAAAAAGFTARSATGADATAEAANRGAEAGPARVQTVAAKTVVVTERLVLHGVTRPTALRKPGFTIGGRLALRPVEVGDRVTAGALLAQLDAAPYENAEAAARAQLRGARIQAKYTKRESERTRRLTVGGAATDQQLSGARTAADGAAASARGARVALRESRRVINETRLVAPFDGVVTAVLAEPGDVVAAGQPIVMLQAGDGAELEVQVPAAWVPSLEQEDSWSVRFPERDDVMVLPVQSVTPPDGRPGAMSRLELRIPPDTRLGPGLRAEVLLTRTGGESVTIPLRAVSAPGGRDPHVFVFVDGTVVRRPVQLGGLVDGGAVVVRQGVAPGEPVVTDGQHRLLDGDEVLASEAVR